MVGYAFCGNGGSESGGEGGGLEEYLEEWEIGYFEKMGYVMWYRVDKNQDELASWDDLRDARGG